MTPTPVPPKKAGSPPAKAALLSWPGQPPNAQAITWGNAGFAPKPPPPGVPPHPATTGGAQVSPSGWDLGPRFTAAQIARAAGPPARSAAWRGPTSAAAARPGCTKRRPPEVAKPAGERPADESTELPGLPVNHPLPAVPAHACAYVHRGVRGSASWHGSHLVSIAHRPAAISPVAKAAQALLPLHGTGATWSRKTNHNATNLVA